MNCILVSSKMYDVKPLSLSTLHKISAFVYNNQMVLNSEKILLKVLNYDVLVRDHLIIDRVGLLLENVKFLLDERDYSKFADLCFKVCDLALEDTSLVKENDQNLLSASIIQACIVISVRREGKLPITVRCKL